MIADEWNVVSSVKRSWNKNGNINWDEKRHHLTFITSDDRVAEVIEATAAWSEDQEKKEGVPFDLVVVPLATGSKEYIEWVKEQTLKKDDSTAFFNVAAPVALKPVTKKVADAAKTEESEAVQTSESTTAENKKSLWSGNSEDDDDDEE